MLKRDLIADGLAALGVVAGFLAVLAMLLIGATEVLVVLSFAGETAGAIAAMAFALQTFAGISVFARVAA